METTGGPNSKSPSAMSGVTISTANAGPRQDINVDLSIPNSGDGQTSGTDAPPISSTARRIVDLRSDTVTRPNTAMRSAMAAAEVDDDVLGSDPTVERLQKHVAQMLGKEAGLFVPSGTMGNLICVLIHCEVSGHCRTCTSEGSHTHIRTQTGTPCSHIHNSRHSRSSLDVWPASFLSIPSSPSTRQRYVCHWRATVPGACHFNPCLTPMLAVPVTAWCPQVRGSEVILGSDSHIHYYEQGGISQLGGVHPRTVPNKSDGTMDLRKIELAIRKEDDHFPITRLICVENTHNR